MERIHRFVLARPRAVLATVFVVWLAVLPGLARLEIATDGRALVSPESPAAQDDRRLRAEFGIDDELAVIVESRAAEGIWNVATLRLVAQLSRELGLLEGVDERSLRSLATEPGDNVRPGSLELMPWLTPEPTNASEVAALARRVERVGLYRGTLVSNPTPSKSTAIVFRLRAGADRRRTCDHVQRWLSKQPASGHELCVVGAPVSESRLGDSLLLDLARLVPGAFLVMGLILFVSFRSAWAVVLPLAGVGFALSITLAAMGWCGARVYLTILVLPVILTAVGVADAIHILDDYLTAVRAGSAATPLETLRASLARMWKPVLSAEITTAVGFVSFALSPLPPVRVFGIFAALGVLLYIAWSLVALPAALALLAARPSVVASAARSSRLHDDLAGLCRRAASLSMRRRWIVVAATLGVSAACVWGALRVRVQDSWVDGFSRGSPTFQDAERVNADFAGTHILRIRVDASSMTRTGTIARAHIDGTSVLLPDTRVDDVREVAFEMLQLTPRGLAAGDPLARPVQFIVSGAEPVGTGLRLFLRHPLLSSSRVIEFLPAAANDFDYLLSGERRLNEPDVIARVGAFEDFLGRQTDLGVGKVLGPRAHLTTLDEVLGTSAAARMKRLSTRSGVETSLDLYVRGRGEKRTSEVWNAARDAALVTVLVRHANFVDVGRLFDTIADYEERELDRHGIALSFGGDLALSQAMIGGIVRTQVDSLLGSVLGILCVIAIMTRSPRFGLLCAVPCTLAILVDFAAMGFGGIPLGVATAMFAGMTLGVGVDYAIHVVRAIQRHLAAGHGIEPAILAAFAEIGPAVVVDTLTVGAGFAVMMLSTAPPTRRLGFLLVASISVCLVATLLVLPALARLAYRDRRVVSASPPLGAD